MIQKLGGVTSLSKTLGYKGTSRVGNWKKRGIPANVVLRNPDLFKGLQPKASND